MHIQIIINDAQQSKLNGKSQNYHQTTINQKTVESSQEVKAEN
jgi:hypothetical protein